MHALDDPFRTCEALHENGMSAAHDDCMHIIFESAVVARRVRLMRLMRIVRRSRSPHARTRKFLREFIHTGSGSNISEFRAQ